MKTQSINNDNPTSKSSSTSPKISKAGYQFWGIQISNIPSSTTESQIGNEFKKYGDIFSVKSLSESSMKIIFKSPKKPTSIEDIINEQTKFKVTPLNTTQLPAGKKTDSSTKKPASVKISLMSGPPVSKSGKYNLNKLPLDINTKLIAKNSKLSSSAAPFTSPPRIHTLSTTSKTNNSRDNNTNDEGVFFEAVCKSISHGTTEEQVLDFIRSNIFPSIKDEVVKDGMMMLPGESMAVFELNNKDAINKLTKIIADNSSKSHELLFNGNKFTLQRKTNSDDVPPPNVKGLSIKLDDDDNVDNDPPINSNGVNVVNDKNGVDYLMGFGFEHGIKSSNNNNNKPNDDKKEDVTTPKKNYYFKLPDDAKQCVATQAESLGIPKTSLVLMLGVLTTNGPIPIEHFRGWKQNNPNVNQFLSGNNKNKINMANNNGKNKGDIVPNMDALTDSSDKTDALSSNKSIGSQNNKSFNSNQGSPIGSIGSTPAAAALFGDTSTNGSKLGSSPLNNGIPKKTNKKIVASANNSGLTKAPLVKTGSFNKNKVNNNNNQTQKRMFQYPNNNPLISNNSLGNNISLISPRGVGGGVSLIRMKSNGGVSTNGTLLSPTAAALLSPRRNNGTGLNPPAPVVVPNTDFTKGNVGNGFSMTTPIANLTPVHIPYLGGNAGNNGTNGQSPINSGFQSPINYNINTPQSPINYPGITPIINAFTPTASNVNIQTPTANLPFYWNNLHKNNSFNANNTNNNNQNNGPFNNNMNNNMNNGPMNNGPMNNMNNMDNDPLAPNNVNSGFPFNSNQSNNPYVQQQLQKNNPLLRPPQNNGPNNMGNNGSSPLSKPPSTFFKYPIPSDEPKSSPSNSNNIMNGQMNNGLNNMINSINSLNSLNQQQSHNSFTNDNDNMNNNNGFHHNNNGYNNNMNDDDNNGDDETQMNEPPSLDEINNMRSIPSVISPNGTTPVVMITNLNEDEIDCDKIFTLCGVFGDVQRVKISYHKRDTAFVQLSNHRQAKHVVTSLNRMQLYGKMIHVNLSRMTRVKLPKDSPNSAMMFPDAKFLTKDYTNCKKHRYSKKGAGGIKYSPLSIGQPSHILHIANLPIQSEAKDLQEFLCGNGIFAQQQQKGPRYQNDDKIQSIELIGVNNKLGSCQAFAKCHSVDIACQILIDYHSKEFLGREIKISFATRSHMPSDINKTHKTYSYTAQKRHGASINSIPASIHVAPNQNNNGPNNNGMNNDNNNDQNNMNNNGDNMSSSGSSSNGNHAPMNNNNSNNSHNNHHNHNSYHSHRNNYGNNMGYNNRHNQVCSFPKNVISNRNSYMPNYDNNVGYQTYVVNNKQPPPDQDKIFVRQHHHSGGRKYHYKLRINK